MSTERYPTIVHPTEKPKLLAERQRLLDRKFAGTFTLADEVRLTWIRWQLDSIETRSAPEQGADKAK